MKNLFPKSAIYGVDFSGSKEACKKICICESVPTDKGLLVNDCWNLEKKCEEKYEEKCGNPCDKPFEILTEFIASNPQAIFGLDFPFGLPKTIVDEDTWIDFVKNFPENYSDPRKFRQKCKDRALEKTGKKELKRDTDIEADSPFCPYVHIIFVFINKHITE